LNDPEIPLRGRLVVVAGGGHFGARAARYAKESRARVMIVDTDPHCAAADQADRTLHALEKEALEIGSGSAVFIVQNAVELMLSLLRLKTPDYIAPAVPGHFAGWVVERWLKSNGLQASPASKATRKIATSMPQGTILHVDESRGVIIVSHMPEGLSCKVPCPQPGDRCPTTGRTKAGPMHSLLAKAAEGNVSLSRVLVSRLMGPEAGCFRGAELTSILADAGRLKPPYTLAVGTSCECHGIMNLFSVTKP
jgi:hypothetical protein